VDDESDGLAVSTQYTKVTDTQPRRHPSTARQQEPRYAVSLGYSRAAKSNRRVYQTKLHYPQQETIIQQCGNWYTGPWVICRIWYSEQWCGQVGTSLWCTERNTRQSNTT